MSNSRYMQVSTEDSEPPPEWPKKLRNLTTDELDRITVDSSGRFFWDGKPVMAQADLIQAANAAQAAQAAAPPVPPPPPQLSAAETLEAIRAELEAKAPGRLPPQPGYDMPAPSFEPPAYQPPGAAPAPQAADAAYGASYGAAPGYDDGHFPQPQPPANDQQPVAYAPPPVSAPVPVPVPSAGTEIVPLPLAAPVIAADPKIPGRVRLSLSFGQGLALLLVVAGWLFVAAGLGASGFVAVHDWGCRNGTFQAGCPAKPAASTPAPAPARRGIID